MSAIVTFGEIMGRLAPEGFLRFRQAMPGKLDLTFAGAEANVAVSLALLGGEARFVTAVPKNPLGEGCLATLRGCGVDTRYVLQRDKGRLGLYFVETGANQRPGVVVYDRDGSCISQTPADQYAWDAIFAGAQWFHVTGITPALSSMAAEAVVMAAQKARAAGLQVSCDLNFRKKLWKWDPAVAPRDLAEKTMRRIVPCVDLLIANEEDADDVLRIRAADTDVHAGRLAADRYPDVARAIVGQFPNVKRVAITLRESVSASHNHWGGMLFDAQEDRAYFAPLRDGRYQPYSITHIVDRVGGGDAFGAGLIFALTTPELSAPQSAVGFATASSCLAHSVYGDFNYVTRAEVEALMKGSGSGRVVR